MRKHKPFQFIPMTKKPTLSFWQIWNMSFGFLGIQFGWSLQMANMSPIYEYLGAAPEDIPILWLAAPMTGLIVQPIIGYFSDRTWNWLGRRKPYFLTGAILASLALLIMPNSSALWMAAGLLWILDASINISMEPFRAFVVDMCPEKQRTRGFAMQSLMIGLGSVIAFAMPYLLTNVLGVESSGSENEGVPLSVRISFYIGSLVYIGAVLWTIISTKEYPPDLIQSSGKENYSEKLFKEIFNSIKNMPKTMRQVSLVQFVTWPGLFLMFFYFSTAVAAEIFHGQPGTDTYREGVEWAGICFAFYSLVTFVFSFFIPKIADLLGKKITHLVCLTLGGIGLISVYFINEPFLLLISMTGVGMAWTSILAMPYSLMAGSLPTNKVGIYMGIFNFFIVLPEIIASLFFGWIMHNLLGNSRVTALVIGGILFILAGILTLRVKEE
ncbi:MAG: MFS transporter [Bacteroidales bacterium]|nr:MFS transporter [Bacteroidales bacterium]